jgi:hypothetical protein
LGGPGRENHQLQRGSRVSGRDPVSFLRIVDTDLCPRHDKGPERGRCDLLRVNNIELHRIDDSAGQAAKDSIVEAPYPSQTGTAGFLCGPGRDCLIAHPIEKRAATGKVLARAEGTLRVERR